MGRGLPLGTGHYVPGAADLHQLLGKRESETPGHTETVLAVREPAPTVYPVRGTPPYTHLSAAYKTQDTELGTHFPVG